MTAAAYTDFITKHPGRDLDLGSLRYHYIDEGQGDPVVMLHGNPTWSFYYRNLINALSPTYRVIVPDHVGCGRSDKPSDARYEYTLKSRVDDLERLLDRLQINSKITLVLHDWGGMIGMAYAARFPERIRRLVILNTGAFQLPKSKPMPWQLTVCRSAVGGWLVRGLNMFVSGTANLGCTHHPMSADVRSAYAEPYNSYANRIAVHRFVQDIPLKPGDRAYDLVSDVESKLSLFQDRPMFIAWGLKDPVFDAHFLAEWERRFPDAEVHRFEKSGHYILEDEAAEVIPQIVRFLAKSAIS